MFQAIRNILQRALQDFAAQRRFAAARDEFARLDASTVRDLGMSRSEFKSHWVESHGLAERTRVRVDA